MNLLAPAALGLAALAIPIVAMYILKMRRPPREIPSTFLWEQALHVVQANAPWQRLRRNLLLLLQVLALAALVLALARPYVLRAAAAPGDVVAVIDASPLMGATDVAPSRFAAAKSRVGALIDGLAQGDVMSIVLMAGRPRVLIAQSGDHGALHAALDRATLDYETPDIAAALSVGEALARGGRHASLFVYTAKGDPAIAVPSNLPFKVVKVALGGNLRDLGIVAFAASRATDGSVTVLTRVSNLGQRTVASTLQIDVATGTPGNPRWRSEAALHPLSLGAGQSTVKTDQRLPGDVIAVRAHLLGGDQLAADDTAWAVVPQASTRHVLLVAPADPGDWGRVTLQTALSVIPGVSLRTVTPDAYTPSLARCADVAVFDGPDALHRRLPGTGTPILAVGPDTAAGQRLGVPVGKPASAGSVQEGADPFGLLSGAAARDRVFNQITPLGVPTWGYAALRAGGAPIIVAGQNGARREAVLGFQVYNSDWGYNIGFPILVDNLVSYLAPAGSLLTGTYRPGDPVALPASACATGVIVATPGQGSVSVPPPYPAQPFLGTDQPGLYTVAQKTPSGTERALFAVNLFPLPPSTAGQTSVAGGGAQPSTTISKAQVPLELAPFVALGALAILIGEWWVAAHRR